MSLLLKELISIGVRRLADCGVADNENDAKELYCYLVKTDRTGLMMRWSEIVPDNRCEAYFDLIEERASRIPLQHITGEQEFMGYPFKVNEHVLIPRQDTETMVEDAVELLEKGSLRGQPYGTGKPLKGAEVLDMCCGSGAIGLSLSKTVKGIKVTCSDLSKEALQVARENKESLKCDGVYFIESDMLEGAAFNGRLNTKKYNLIISNPPYIASQFIEGLEPEVREHEPKMALDGGADGLIFYRKIAEQVPEHLKKKGILMMEIGFDQKDAVQALLTETGRFENIICLQDLTGKDRIIVAMLNGVKPDKKAKKESAPKEKKRRRADEPVGKHERV